MRVQLRATALAAGALIALASVSAAQAQTTVSMYGLVDLSAGRSQAPGGVASNGVNSGNMSTSYFGLKGSEDLGGGMSAQFAIESFLRGDSGSAGRFDADVFWARSAYVGLSGGFGSVAIGRNTTSLFVNTLIFNAFGDSFGYSPSIRHNFTSGTVTGDTGWADSIKYTSPRFGGLSFTGHIAANDEGAGSGRNTGLSALYFGGALGLGFAWQKVEKGATTADTTTWQLGGSYALGDTKLFAQYGSVDNDTSGMGYDITGLGASIKAGAGNVLAQWGRISPDSGAKRTTFSVGYDYFLSKRTDLYAVFMSDKISGLSGGTNYGVGIRHKF